MFDRLDAKKRATFESLDFNDHILRYYMNIRGKRMVGLDENADPIISKLDEDQRNVSKVLGTLAFEEAVWNPRVGIDYDSDKFIDTIGILVQYDSNRIFLERRVHNGSAVFAQASRLNHDCKPNAIHVWNNTTNKGTIHALRYIGADEEITISYCQEGRYDRKTRQHWIKTYHFFDCICYTCLLPPHHPFEKQLEQITGLREIWEPPLNENWIKARIGNYKDTKPTKEALNAIQMEINILADRGLRNADLAWTLHDKSRLYSLLGRPLSAWNIKIKAYELIVSIYGLDHPYVEKRLRELTLIRSMQDSPKRVFAVMDTMQYQYMPVEVEGAPEKDLQMYEEQKRWIEQEEDVVTRKWG